MYSTNMHTQRELERERESPTYPLIVSRFPLHIRSPQGSEAAGLNPRSTEWKPKQHFSVTWPNPVNTMAAATERGVPTFKTTGRRTQAHATCATQRGESTSHGQYVYIYVTHICTRMHIYICVCVHVSMYIHIIYIYVHTCGCLRNLAWLCRTLRVLKNV